MDHDVVLLGATGFAGKLVAEYLASHPSQTSFSWAIAGRSPDKLAALRSSLTGVAPEIIVADTAERPSIDAMVSKARVVLTTAGPYSEHGGDVVVEACARQGRHYADLTGEYWFQRAMIDQFHEEAQRTGAKIVHAAGVDSIPSDLGTQLAIEQLERRGERAAHVKALFTHYAGSFSGGTNRTLESLAQLPESGQYAAAFCNDPYVLAPSAEGKVEGETITGWDERRFDRDFGRLGTPFFMAPINARNVRRSLALSGRLPAGGGVLTPALALGSVLRQRLAAVEGGEFMHFRVLSS